MTHSVLALYPEAFCTRISVYQEDQEVLAQRVCHDPEELNACESIPDQLTKRAESLERFLTSSKTLKTVRLDALIAPGGILDRVQSGVYRVDEALLKQAGRNDSPQHPSNLGASLVHALSTSRNIPAFVADPLSVDEADPISKITGLPEMSFIEYPPTLNIKATVRAAAADLKKTPEELSVVVAHLGKRFSICAHRDGRMTDVSSSSELGAFSPVSCGKLPAKSVVRMAYSGAWSKRSLSREIHKRGGLIAWLGTKDLKEVGARILQDDKKADSVYKAMAYGVATEIAAQATTLNGRVDAILMTGGCAQDPHFLALIQKRVQWIAPVLNYPDEDVMKALASSALRVLRDQEQPKDYSETVRERKGH